MKSMDVRRLAHLLDQKHDLQIQIENVRLAQLRIMITDAANLENVFPWLPSNGIIEDLRNEMINRIQPVLSEINRELELAGITD